MRMIKLLLLIVMLLTGLTGLNQAAEPVRAQGDPLEEPLFMAETCRRVIIRTGPDITYPEVERLPDATPVEVLEWEVPFVNDYKWARIRVPGTDVEGWTWSYYLYRPPVSAMLTAETIVREMPTRRAPEITRWPAGQMLEVVEAELIRTNGGLWYRMRAADTGVEGWIHVYYNVNFLERGCNTPVTPFSGHPFPAAVWSGWPVPVFAEPDPRQRAIAYLENGMTVTVTDRNGGGELSYMQTADGSIAGWVYDRQLTYLPVALVVRAGALNVRAVPGEAGSITGTLANGACVDAVQVAQADGGVWFYVRQAGTGLEGWVTARYMVFLSGVHTGIRNTLDHPEAMCPGG